MAISKWLNKGCEDGRRDEQKAMAKKMREDGMPVEAIAKYISLTKKEIESLE